MEPDVNSAIRKGYLQQVRYLLELGSSPNCRNDERRTPLMNCALIEDELWGVGVARTLMEKGAAMNLTCRRGMNVLHYACIYGRKDLMEVLLGSADFDIIHPERQGNTPLHYAAAMGHEHLVSILIDAMRKYHLGLDKVNNLGFTALMLASRGGHELCSTTLLSRGADVTPRDSVELMTAKEYEEEFKQSKKGKTTNRLHKDFVLHVPQNRRPFSALSYVSGSYQSTRAGSAHVRSRPESASLLERRRGGRGEKTKEEVVDEDYLTTAEKERAAGSMIRCVSLSNLRNKPEQLLNISPMACFVKDTRYHSSNNPSSISTHRHNSSPAFKSQVKNLYSAFQFQFTKSYCRPARPSGLGIINKDNCGNGDGGEKSRKQRKYSVKSTLSIDEKLDRKTRKMSAKSSSRKSSITSMSSLKSEQTLLDGSSNGSVNSTFVKSVRKRNPNEIIDVVDVCNFDKNSPTDKNTKCRTRKVSAVMDDHVMIINESSRTVSRSVSIPGIKESVQQEQLGAIRE